MFSRAVWKEYYEIVQRFKDLYYACTLSKVEYKCFRTVGQNVYNNYASVTFCSRYLPKEASTRDVVYHDIHRTFIGRKLSYPVEHTSRIFHSRPLFAPVLRRSSRSFN